MLVMMFIKDGDKNITVGLLFSPQFLFKSKIDWQKEYAFEETEMKKIISDLFMNFNCHDCSEFTKEEKIVALMGNLMNYCTILDAIDRRCTMSFKRIGE